MSYRSVSTSSSAAVARTRANLVAQVRDVLVLVIFLALDVACNREYQYLHSKIK